LRFNTSFLRKLAHIWCPKQHKNAILKRGKLQNIHLLADLNAVISLLNAAKRSAFSTKTQCYLQQNARLNAAKHNAK
jgi:hypothetical protein